ncbi:MAG: hypothetical protein JJE09_10875 [Bacteroidia bacterium]|nr:hypothetical protein [Bacteroidia bacterium]
MVKTIADILNSLLIHERQKLDEFKLDHPPTIGRMYEGLTANILEKAIPSQLGLQVVSGIIYDDSGTMTGEIDCMLVKGAGIVVPYTSSYKWHIKDVIVVFEVKKTLYSNDLSDAFNHVRGVLDSYERYIDKGRGSSVQLDISPARRAFALTTKKIAPDYSKLSELSFSDEAIFHILVMEQLAPVRIILGHHGFQSEFAFRKAMIKFLEVNTGKNGFGAGSFPQLIISENYSLIKANGQPYNNPMRNDFWDFYVSSSENPLLLLLELVWTRLERDFPIGGLWGDDLELECFHPFLSGRVIKIDDKYGWEYQYHNLTKKNLISDNTPEKWTPVILNVFQFGIINRLCVGTDEFIDNPELISYIEANGLNMTEFVNSLLETGLIALDGNKLELTTHECTCAILPTGEFVAAENNSGRFSRWLAKKIAEDKNTHPSTADGQVSES